MMSRNTISMFIWYQLHNYDWYHVIDAMAGFYTHVTYPIFQIKDNSKLAEIN